MKKFISVSLIVAVILLFIGAMFGGIGYAVGGVSYRLQMAEGFKQSLFNEEALRSEYNISASNISNYANVFFDDWEDDSYTIYAGEVGLVGREEIVVSEDIKAIYCKVDATNMEIRVSEDDTY